VDHSLLSRLRDRMPVNQPYEGRVAEGYDAWIPVDEVLPEEPVYLDILEEVGGTALELGCGTGRPLLRWLGLGHDVEGVDASADMLAILHRHAAERGLEPVTHHGDIAPLRLGRTYHVVLCPAGTFSLIHELAEARAAVASYLAHLVPGGVLALTAFVPVEDLGEQMTWRVRRTGTTADGTTIVVDEATCCDIATCTQTTFNRLGVYDEGGRLQETLLRRVHLRWWPRDDLEALLESAGFVDLRHVGGDDGWVTMARRPG
jgi:SAM-dependent methyltransferase